MLVLLLSTIAGWVVHHVRSTASKCKEYFAINSMIRLKFVLSSLSLPRKARAKRKFDIPHSSLRFEIIGHLDLLTQ